ncbi:MAG TPA: kynureninase [Flavitalea sp.]|nr:kynureninase [Flavitalea sp.]
MHFENGIDFAQDLDRNDTLQRYRSEFILPEEKGMKSIYFLGNSLGLQPKKTTAEIDKVLRQWSDYGVEGFFKGDAPWLNYHDKLTGPLSKIVGALPSEVVVMNQLTVNLHLMLTSFYKPDGKRNKIICEAKAFPSDQYMLETHVMSRGMKPADVIIEVLPRPGSVEICEEDILQKINEHADETALVFWGGVNYYTGQLFDMKAITKAAHDAGATAGFDLAHAVGNVPLHLHDWDVDFACWCSYKYLNSGPGAVGGVFIHEKFHTARTMNRLAGWWGYRKSDRFKMAQGFIPIDTAEGWHLSTPSMILYATHFAALTIFEEAGMNPILEKGKSLNDYFHFLLNRINEKFSTPPFRILTPAASKGNQVSLLINKNGKQLFEKLCQKGVMGDWREPDVIRLAPVPLYNKFEEVYNCCKIIEQSI